MGAVSPRIITFGCRLNAFESEVLRERLGGASDNVIVVNTCAVTAEAQRQARQAIRRARRESPSARIVVTGCAAQVDPGSFAAMPEVDRVVGNARKLDPGVLLARDNRVQVEDVMATGMESPVEKLARFGARAPVGAQHLMRAGIRPRTRAFVQVQQGCDHRCTFCIVPFARGPARSVPLGAVVERVRALGATAGGGWSDRVGRRRAIVLGWTIYASVYFAMAYVRVPSIFVLLLLVYGLYYNLIEGAYGALVADLVPAGARGRAYGLFHGLVGAATLPASFAAGALYAYTGPKAMFLAGAALAVGGALLLMTVPEARPSALSERG